MIVHEGMSGVVDWVQEKWTSATEGASRLKAKLGELINSLKQSELDLEISKVLLDRIRDRDPIYYERNIGKFDELSGKQSELEQKLAEEAQKEGLSGLGLAPILIGVIAVAGAGSFITGALVIRSIYAHRSETKQYLAMIEAKAKGLNISTRIPAMIAKRSMELKLGGLTLPILLIGGYLLYRKFGKR